MSFHEEWVLSYPIPNEEYGDSTLFVRARSAGQGSKGQYEFSGTEFFPDGTLLNADELNDHMVKFDVLLPSSGLVIPLTTCYPVRDRGKPRILPHEAGIRPITGDLINALFLLPKMGNIKDSLPLQDSGFAERTFWMETAAVKPVKKDDDVYTLEIIKLFFATGSRYQDNQFSAIDFDYERRVNEIISVCEQGSKLQAGGLPAALRYFHDVLTGELEFDYDIGDFMRGVIANYLIAEKNIDYKQGEDLLPALRQLIDIAPRIPVQQQEANLGNFNLRILPNEYTTGFARRFITALLAKPFVIITGNSGTGKTRIAKRFAKYLEVPGGNDGPNWLLVPVGADWTDNTKVLGFYNPLGNKGSGTYEETGILRLIKRANKYRDVPHFLILDEMNLSHVERYFSDFLSHMETIGEDNYIVLDGYDKSDGGADSRLLYPQNLFVIGTVNIDETTYMFSPKVLDRANVIEFKPSKDDVLSWFTSTEEMREDPVAAQGIAQSFLRLALDIRADISYINAEDSSLIRDEFSVLYDALEKYGYEFAYRTVREMRRYISAAHELDGDGYDLARAIDEQVVQKVLPKLHGNRREIGVLLVELAKICQGELSSAKIKQMQDKLTSVQYASFI